MCVELRQAPGRLSQALFIRAIDRRCLEEDSRSRQPGGPFLSTSYRSDYMLYHCSLRLMGFSRVEVISRVA